MHIVAAEATCVSCPPLESTAEVEAKVPTGQPSHFATPPAEKVPALQLVHAAGLVSPDLGLAVPGGHPTHLQLMKQFGTPSTVSQTP